MGMYDKGRVKELDLHAISVDNSVVPPASVDHIKVSSTGEPGQGCRFGAMALQIAAPSQWIKLSVFLSCHQTCSQVNEVEL